MSAVTVDYWVTVAGEFPVPTHHTVLDFHNQKYFHNFCELHRNHVMKIPLSIRLHILKS